MALGAHDVKSVWATPLREVAHTNFVLTQVCSVIRDSLSSL